MLAGILGGGDFALHAALAKAAGNQNGVVAAKLLLGAFGGDGFGVDMVNLHAHMVLHTGVFERFVHRFVGI